MSRGKHFSQKELDFIKVHSLDMSIKEIALALNRNYWAIHRIIQKKLGVEKSHNFTVEDDYFLKRTYPKLGAKYCATVLGVDEISVYNRVQKLNIRKNGRNV